VTDTVIGTPTGAADPEGTRTPGPAGDAPPLRPRELLRWAWRQLTSMRTALLLLLLLALTAVPGSVVPQRDVDALEVGQWKADHPGLTPVYERLGLFSVYDSPWFSAVYLLLMVSLAGCIVPRTAVYWRALRAAPPRAPKNLSRLPAYARFETDADPETVRQQARAALRSRRYRVARDTGPDAAGATQDAVAAERGHVREAGNLLFHISVIVVLVGFAYGQLLGYKGGAIVLVGRGFSNTLSQYDDFNPGSLFDPESLPPMSLDVDDFRVRFLPSGPQAGQPADFAADVTYREDPSAPARSYELKVNEPLQLDGVDVFLVGHGYAPVLTVTDGDGNVTKGPVAFLPQDASFASFGVLKLPDASPDQLGFEGMFYPTYASTGKDPYSAFPDALRPVVSLFGYHGDLGLDDGRPQSVYQLDTSGLTRFEKAAGNPVRFDLDLGETKALPDGQGSIRFDGYRRWVKLQVSNTPGKGLALAGIVLGLVGLMGSLFVRRRRAWVRVTRRDGTTLVEVAGLDRSTVAEGLDDEVRRLAEALGAPPGTATTRTTTGSDTTTSTRSATP
jgi:cytochrome c biogenesis protein